MAEIFQWRGEVGVGLPGFSDEERAHVGQELSDVLLYLVRLAERCHVDLAAAVQAKVRHNAEKYPAHLVKGSSKKYNEYRAAARAAKAAGADEEEHGGDGGE